MKSRPIQYLGLAALLLLSLAVIFLPIGPRPDLQPFTVPLVAPQPFQQLIASTQKVPDVAEEALSKAFPTSTTLPGVLTLGADGKTATIEDKATTRAEATARANQIVAALGAKFKGVKLAPSFTQNIEKLPAQPLFPISTQLAVYPPKTQNGSAVPAVKLGLDLQGGVNLVLQVRRALFAYTIVGVPTAQTAPAAQAREEFLGKVRSAFAQTASDAGLRGSDVSFNATARNQLEIRTQASDRAQFDLQTKVIDTALKTVAGAGFKSAKAPQFYLPQEKVGQSLGYGGDYSSQLLDKTVEIIRSRVDKLGVSEPLIQKQLPDRVIVQLPGVNDPQEAIKVIGTTAQMEIRLLPADIEGIPNEQTGKTTFFDKTAKTEISSLAARQRSELIVAGIDVKPTTSAGFAEGGKPAVFFELQGEGARKFAQVTTQVARKGRQIPVFLDDECITAPTVDSPITGGSGQISGGYKSVEEARGLAVLLNSGALPAPIDVVENRTVSATLGQDSLLKSLRAGAIGLLCVAVFMTLYYRLAGVLANFALIIYCVLNLAVFVLVGGTLTLPGIAGFLLALAMSLDTNILVFERLKEEMTIQPTFAAALRAAFSRAWTAILDSHVTTLIAATVLFYFGTGPIKGFALTLGIGVLLSLFSAISVTRLFMWSAAGAGERNRGFFAGKLPPAEKVLAERGAKNPIR